MNRPMRTPRFCVIIVGSGAAGGLPMIDAPTMRRSGRIFADAVRLLQPSGENFATSFDLIDLIVPQPAPLFPRSAFELLPSAQELVPIHRRFPTRTSNSYIHIESSHRLHPRAFAITRKV